MKLALAVTTPDVTAAPPVALLSGTFEQKLDKARAMGYEGVELMVMDPAQVDPAWLADTVRQAGLEIAALASGAIAFAARLTLLHADAETRTQARRRLQALIHLAAQVGAPLATIGSFRGWARSAGVDGRGLFITALREAGAWAEQAGVRLALEPLNRYEADLINSAADGLDIVAEVGSPAMGLLLDTYHMNIEEASLPEAVKTVMRAGRLWHVHLGDSNRLAPGQGHVDFTALVATLRRAGYAGYLSAELLARPDADTAARQTAEYMRSVLGAD